MLVRSPAAKKSKPRASQLKLAGIATVQGEPVVETKAQSGKQKSLLDAEAPKTDKPKAAQSTANTNSATSTAAADELLTHDVHPETHPKTA